MSEVRPNFTYDGESDILHINSTLDEEPAVATKQLEGVGQLESLGGVMIEQQANQVNVDIEIVKSLGKYFNNYGDTALTEAIRNINAILFSDPQGMTDRVVGMTSWHYIGAHASIFPQFQRWLNSSQLSDEEVRQAIIAMTLPFGEDQTQKAKDDFTDLGRGGYTAWSYRVAVRSETFGLHKQEETDDSFVVTDGRVAWNSIDLSTLGDCACWGPTGEERNRIHLRPDSSKLYDLSPHNWDFARQSLSLVLGLGSLAYHASRHEGREDIFADVEWQEPRIYPKSRSV